MNLHILSSIIPTPETGPEPPTRVLTTILKGKHINDQNIIEGNLTLHDPWVLYDFS